MPTIKVKNIKTGQWEKLPTLKGDKGEPGVQGLPGKDYILTSEDKTEIGNNVKTDIQPVLNTIENKSEEAISIAKGANQSLVYNNYSEMITIFNNLSNDVYKVGQNILIVTLNVPDLWIAEILDANISYEYISDENFVDELKENGYVQIGYYKISALETQKVDLTDVNEEILKLENNKLDKEEAASLTGIPTDGIIAIDGEEIPEGYEEIQNPNLDVYSLKETRTNKVWIDGKPIYRRVLHFGYIPGGWITKEHDIENLESVTFMQAFDKTKGGTNETTFLPYSTTDGTGYCKSITLFNSETLQFNVGIQHYLTDCWAIIEYTKTTD